MFGVSVLLNLDVFFFSRGLVSHNLGLWFPTQPLDDHSKRLMLVFGLKWPEPGLVPSFRS